MEIQRRKNMRDRFRLFPKFIWDDTMGVEMSDGSVKVPCQCIPKGEPALGKILNSKAVITLNGIPIIPSTTLSGSLVRQCATHWAWNTMICFNFGRPEKDGTYTERTKYGMIGVIIHEVGHKFPMIVNSDERQWTWMDEGIELLRSVPDRTAVGARLPSRRGMLTRSSIT